MSDMTKLLDQKVESLYDAETVSKEVVDVLDLMTNIIRNLENEVVKLQTPSKTKKPPTKPVQ